jgi:hypothetical protein
MRSGTTSVAQALAEHPDVFMPPGKEIHFFDQRFDLGVEWYRARFAGARGQAAIGEATPRYMYDPRAVARMADVIPDARLVAILRNPVDRAYSHWQHERARGREDLPFAGAVDAEPHRLESEDAIRASHFAYLDRGRYLGQLRRVCRHFPREALHVVIFERFRESPEPAYAALCRFLGVDEGFRPGDLRRAWNPSYGRRSERLGRIAGRAPRAVGRVLSRLNVHRTPSLDPMEPAVRLRLLERFAEENAALASWLDADLSLWGS